MSELINGGPAFPGNNDSAHDYAMAAVVGISDVHERDRIYLQAKAKASAGMSLRDYFAAKVLPSLQATYPEESSEDVAKWAYNMADAMLAAREDAPVADSVREAAPVLLEALQASTKALIAERDAFYDSITDCEGNLIDPADGEALRELDALIDRNQAAIAKAGAA